MTTPRPLRMLALAIATLLLAACQTVQLVSDYDETTEQTATALQRKMSDFFLRLQSLPPGDPGLAFAASQDFYREAAVDIGAIQVRAEGIRLNDITRRELQLLENNLALLVLNHKQCFEGTMGPTAEQLARVEAMGVDVSDRCRVEYGAAADRDGRGGIAVNPNLLGNVRGQFDQTLGAIIALELAKRRGE